MSTPSWSIECDYMESCNCDFGCTCNFSGIPTAGRCEALVGYHVRKGNFGNVSLDGLDFIYAASWPRAIHQGDGTSAFTSQIALLSLSATPSLKSRMGAPRAAELLRSSPQRCVTSSIPEVVFDRSESRWQAQPVCGPWSSGSRALATLRSCVGKRKRRSDQSSEWLHLENRSRNQVNADEDRHPEFELRSLRPECLLHGCRASWTLMGAVFANAPITPTVAAVQVRAIYFHSQCDSRLLRFRHHQQQSGQQHRATPKTWTCARRTPHLTHPARLR